MASGDGRSKVNPFQIEDIDAENDNDDDKWQEGDYYYDDDLMDDDEATKEVRGLLGAPHSSLSTSSLTHRPQWTSTIPKSTRRRTNRSSSSSSSYPVGRILTVLGGTTLLFWIILSTTSSGSKNGPLKQTKNDDEVEPFVATTKTQSSSSLSPLVVPLSIRTPTTTPSHAPSALTMPKEGDMAHHHPIDDNNTTVDTNDTDTDSASITTTTAAPTTTPPPETTEYDDFVPADRVPADAIVLTDDDEWNDDPSRPEGGGSNNHTHNKPLRPYNPKPKPLYFIVLGERHSGVDYILKVLHDCFGDEHRYGSGYNRDAPWFQTYDDVDVAFRMDAHMHYRVILILATRNPYDWVQDMYHKPQYLGEWDEEEEEDETKHKVVVSLKDFVTRPWSYPQIPDNTTNGFCQLNYLLGQVSPCLQFPDAYRFPKSVPVYELNATTSRPYANILEFRAAKIQHWMIHLNQSWGISPMILPMDNNNPWTTEFANDLFNRTAGEEICLPTTNNTMPYVVESYANTSSVKFMEWMNANVNWEMEQIIGYYTRQQQL